MVISILRTLLTRAMPEVDRIIVWLAPEGQSCTVKWRYEIGRSVFPGITLVEGPSELQPELVSTGEIDVRREPPYWRLAFTLGRAPRFLDAQALWLPDAPPVEFPFALPFPFALATLGGRIPEIQLGSELPAGYAAADIVMPPDGTRVVTTLLRGPIGTVSLPTVRGDGLGARRSRVPAHDAIARTVEMIEEVLQLGVQGTVVLADAGESSWLTDSALGVVLLSTGQDDSISADAALTTSLVWQLSSLWWGGVLRAAGKGSGHLLDALRFATIALMAVRLGRGTTLGLSSVESEVRRLSPDWHAFFEPSLSDAKRLLGRDPEELRTLMCGVLRDYAGQVVPVQRLRQALLLHTKG